MSKQGIVDETAPCFLADYTKRDWAYRVRTCKLWIQSPLPYQFGECPINQSTSIVYKNGEKMSMVNWNYLQIFV